MLVYCENIFVTHDLFIYNTFLFSKHAKRHPYFDPELLRQRWTSGSTGTTAISTDSGSGAADRSDGSDSLLSP